MKAYSQDYIQTTIKVTKPHSNQVSSMFEIAGDTDMTTTRSWATKCVGWNKKQIQFKMLSWESMI